MTTMQKIQAALDNNDLDTACLHILETMPPQLGLMTGIILLTQPELQDFMVNCYLAGLQVAIDHLKEQRPGES